MPIRIKLKDILEHKSISQRELARMTGLRSNTISDLCSERGSRVYLDTLEMICIALDIDVSELLKLEK